jgi:hypothetical protein
MGHGTILQLRIENYRMFIANGKIGISVIIIIIVVIDVSTATTSDEEGGDDDYRSGA